MRCGFWDRGKQCTNNDALWTTDDADLVNGPMAHGTVALCADHVRECRRMNDRIRIDGPEPTLWTILVLSVNSARRYIAIGNDWKFMVWRKRASARDWLRRYAPNWHASGAKVVPYTGETDPTICTIRGKPR